TGPSHAICATCAASPARILRRTSSTRGVRFDVADKRVLVTGGSRGIGLAIARAFVSAGASVAILADREEVFATAAELERERGSAVTPIHCDVTDRARLKAAVGELG